MADVDDIRRALGLYVSLLRSGEREDDATAEVLRKGQEALRRLQGELGVGPRFLDVVFDGPPSHEAPRFVEVEDMRGASVSAGEWIDRGNGLWALRLQVASNEGKLGPGGSL